MKLATETYFKLNRDLDERIEDFQATHRLFTQALRWHPDIDEWPIGGRILKQLFEGDSISQKRLDLGIDYLAAAMVYYSPQRIPGPYPERDQEAYADIDALLQALSEAMEHTV